MLTLQSLTYIKGNNQTSEPIQTMPQEPRHPGKGAKPDHLSNSTVGN